jgi:hypothetical protein
MEFTPVPPFLSHRGFACFQYTIAESFYNSLFNIVLKVRSLSEKSG